jgi:hypothetical protein
MMSDLEAGADKGALGLQEVDTSENQELFSMTVHTKWEILVQKLLKSVELFKSYGLFGEPKVVDFLFFGKMLKK